MNEGVQYHLIIPMCGDGQRFRDAGFQDIKPLITVAGTGKPMFQYVIDSYLQEAGISPRTISFVVRHEHVNGSDLDKRIHEVYPDARIVVTGQTRGAAESVVLAIKQLMHDNTDYVNDAMIIADCDVVLRNRKFKNTLGARFNRVRQSELCVIPTFDSVDLRYSYAAADSNDPFLKVTRLAEKSVLPGNHALTSPYMVSPMYMFLDGFNKFEPQFDKDIHREIYVSTIIDTLIKDFDYNVELVRLNPDTDFVNIGTPEQLSQHSTSLAQ